MRNYILAIILISVGIFQACDSRKFRYEKNIKEAEKILFDDSLGFNDSVARSLVGLYSKFGEKYPEDVNTPDYLYRSADLISNLNVPRKAIEIYLKIYEEYPDYKKAPLCLFISGFLYEDRLQELDKAKDIYEKFIKMHPEHELASDVQIMIKNLGKTPEEIIKEFEEKKKESTTKESES